MRPISVRADERTFRSVDYLSEWALRTDEEELAKRAIGEQTVPPSIKKYAGAGHHPIRHYIGIAPGSTYEFTIWLADDAEQALPDQPFFRMGIKQTGELRARARDRSREQPITLNTYLLSDVYGLSDDLIADLIAEAGEYQRGNHYTLHHAVGVPPAFARDRIVPEVIGSEGGAK